MSGIQELEKVPAPLEAILDRVESEGEVLLRRPDGKVFAIREVQQLKSPLDVPRIQMGITTEEIVQIVREGRQRVWDSEINDYREGPWPGDDENGRLQDK